MKHAIKAAQTGICPYAHRPPLRRSMRVSRPLRRRSFLHDMKRRGRKVTRDIEKHKSPVPF